jgi:hypothetical protein
LTTATAAFAADNNQRAPANTSTSPDQSVTTRPGNPMPQHSGAESSPSGMGGANATEPNQARAQMNNTQGHAADRAAASDRGTRRHMARQGATHGSQRDDRAENAVTEQLNREQIANAGSPQTATRPTDCSANQPGCAPAPGTRGVGTLP